jgi:hypothetical protein
MHELGSVLLPAELLQMLDVGACYRGMIGCR